MFAMNPSIRRAFGRPPDAKPRVSTWIVVPAPAGTQRLCAIAAAAIALAFLPGGVLGEFDPARVLKEPAAVAERFPDPAVSYPTPGFRDGRADFPSHAEVLG